MRLSLLLAVTAALVQPLHAQFDSTAAATAPPDSSTIDSLEIRIIPNVGSAAPDMVVPALSDSIWRWSGARTLTQVFSAMPEMFFYDLGNPGKPVSWSFGGSPRGWDLPAIDGRTLASPIFGHPRFPSVPLEWVERIELLSSPQSLVSGARWNLVTYQFASSKPVTAVRFVQEPNQTILSDAFFTQNIARSTNLHFGFQRMTSDGRFDNGRLGSWNLRSRVRANLTPALNIYADWTYEKTTNGLSGGVDRTTSPVLFNDVQAIVSEPDAYEILAREVYAFTAIARLLPDSSALTRISAAQTDESWEFNRPVSSLAAPRIRRFAFGRSVTARIDQTIALAFARLHLSADHTRDRSKGSESLPPRTDSRTALAASVDLTASDILQPSVAFRLDSRSGTSFPSFAAEVVALPSDPLKLSVSYERRHQFPSLQQQYWTDSLITLAGPATVPREDRVRATLAWTFDSDGIVELSLFRKIQTDRGFFFESATSGGDASLIGTRARMTATGATLSGSARLGAFTVTGSLTGMNVGGPDSLRELLPPVWARWEVLWQDKLADDALRMRIAVRGTFFDRFFGVHPEITSLIDVVERRYAPRRITAIDTYAALEIGNVLLTLSWENVFDIAYYTVATYPMPDRRFVLGVRWYFSD